MLNLLMGRIIGSLMLVALVVVVGGVAVLNGAKGSRALERPAAVEPKPISPHHGAKGDAPHHVVIRPAVQRYLEGVPEGARVLDLGCGDGRFLSGFLHRGWEISCLEIDASAVARGRAEFPKIAFYVGDATAEPPAQLRRGSFDAIISTEVIEHVYSPRGLLRNAYELLKPGGILVLTTPYHGYFKNVAVALAGRHDAHFRPQQDHGHIKFWSEDTLSSLLWEAGFDDLEVTGAGRLPYLWKSMAMKAAKP